MLVKGNKIGLKNEFKRVVSNKNKFDMLFKDIESVLSVDLEFGSGHTIDLFDLIKYMEIKKVFALNLTADGLFILGSKFTVKRDFALVRQSDDFLTQLSNALDLEIKNI